MTARHTAEMVRDALRKHAERGDAKQANFGEPYGTRPSVASLNDEQLARLLREKRERRAG